MATGIPYLSNINLLASPTENSHVITVKYLNDTITALNLATTYAPASHNHAASEITSGTISTDRLSKATASNFGVVQIGTGIAIDSGVISLDTHSHAATDISCLETSVTDDDAKIPSSGAVVDYVASKIYSGNTAGFVTSVTTLPSVGAVVDYTEATYVKTTAVGTAAALNTGTSSGNIPVLDTNGKLAESVIPKIAITSTYTVASESAMLALSNAQEGDIAIRTDESKTYILASSESGAYSTKANWKELATPVDAVSSVNSKTGTVTLGASDVGAIDISNLVTSVASTSTDTTVPSALSVYTFVNTNYAAVSHNHSGSEITSGTIDSARLPVASSSTSGAVKIGSGLTMTDGVLSADANSLRYSGTITGDGSTTNFTVTHNLGVKDVFVTLIDSNDNVNYAAITYTSTSALKVSFGTAPENGVTYRVIVRS